MNRKPTVLKGSRFVAAVLEAARNMLYKDAIGIGVIVIHPSDYPHIEKYCPHEFRVVVYPQHHQHKGSLHLGQHWPPVDLCTSVQCPKGYVYVGTGGWMRPELWGTPRTWGDLNKIAAQWPNVDPELAKQLYPRPPKAKPLTDAQRALLVRAIGRPALTHWKSAALRDVIELGYAKALPEMGQGYYRTTDRGRKALKIWRSAWDRIVDDAPCFNYVALK